jgi:hypothetical protein
VPPLGRVVDQARSTQGLAQHSPPVSCSLGDVVRSREAGAGTLGRGGIDPGAEIEFLAAADQNQVDRRSARMRATRGGETCLLASSSNCSGAQSG